MNDEKVLISAIGSHDPFSDDGADGAMLHIVKQYKPVKVYLYFTQGMLEKKGECEDAVGAINSEIAVESIETDIDNAADFDAYHEEFSSLINRVREENTEAKILLNVTSGTSQMTLAFCAEVLSHKEVLFPIQVDNPRFNKNPNRCKEPGLLGLRKTVLKRQIKDMLNKWDYTGAYFLTKGNKMFSERLEDLLHHAYLRSVENIDAWSLAGGKNLISIRDKLYPLPERIMTTANENMKIEARKAFNNFQILIIKQKRGEITDFVLRTLAISEFLVNRELKNELDRFTSETDGVRTWKANISDPKLMPALRQKGYVYRKELNSHAYSLLAGYFGKNEYSVLFKKELRALRNGAAHGLNPITEDMLRIKCQLSSDEILNQIKLCLGRLYKVRDINRCKSFTIFEDLNNEIRNELDRSELSKKNLSKKDDRQKKSRKKRSRRNTTFY